MYKKILIIGGHGGVGRALVESLVRYYKAEVFIGGRNEEKGLALKEAIQRKYPDAILHYRQVDAADRKSLERNFQDVNLAIVTATIPEKIGLVAEVALEAKIDLIDILFRGDALEILRTMSDEISDQGCRFITQGGFHPGILAPFIRLAADDFDALEEARIFMAMDPIFKKPASIKEMLYELIHSKAMLLEESQWRMGSYRDAHRWTFNHYFGKKSCYPLNMPEIYGLEKDLGLKYAGVYAAGFDRYIDQVLFPLVMILGKINGNLAQNLGSRLFYNHIRKYRDRMPRVELCLHTRGLKSNKIKEIIWSLVHDDGFQLTALAVVALLNQLLRKPVEEPGLYLMGQIADHQELFSDLLKMGVIIEKEGTLFR